MKTNDRIRGRIEKAVLYIEDNLSINLRAPDIAKHAHLSPFHFPSSSEVTPVILAQKGVQSGYKNHFVEYPLASLVGLVVINRSTK
jgi:hypothetical protein